MPFTSTWPLAAPLVESGRLVTSCMDGRHATKLKISVFSFLIEYMNSTSSRERSRLNSIFRMLHPINTQTIFG